MESPPDPPDEVSRRRGKSPVRDPFRNIDKVKRPPSKEKVRKMTDRQLQTKSALYHLTPQELRFVKSIAVGASTKDAISAAGYRGDGERARVRGWRLMQRPVVRAAIYELKVQAFDKASIEVTQWLRETAAIAFMPPEMIEGKPRWSDKMNALAKIGEFQKFLNNQPTSSREVSVITLITQSAKATPVIQPSEVIDVEPTSE